MDVINYLWLVWTMLSSAEYINKCTWFGLESARSQQCTSSGWGRSSILGMNQKHILFPGPGISQPPYVPQNFSLLATSTRTPPPSYLPSPSPLAHLISHSFHLKSWGHLPSLNSTELQRVVRPKAWGRWRAQCWRNVQRRKQEECFIPNVEAREER
jgi:hypothetical protein